MAFDLQGARAEGYSDAEIADYLGSQSKFDVVGARREGYSDAEIIGHLSGQPTRGGVRPQVSAAQQRANADAAKRAASTPGIVRSLNNGFAFNAAGNLDALGAAAETGLHNAFAHLTGQPDSGYGMREAFSAVRGTEANATNAFAQQHPVQNVTANVLGAVANPINRLAGGYVARSGNLGAGLARSVATGAALGGAYGAGGTQPGQNALMNAGTGAALGAATGTALPVVGRAASVAGRAINNATGQRLMGPAAAAAARLRQALQADGVDGQTIANAVDEYQRTGAMPPALADVAGENTRALLRFAGSRPGAARNMAQGYRDTTVESVPDASINRARGLTPGDTRTAAQTAEDLTQARQAAAQSDYAPAYGASVQIDDATASALADAPGRAALQRARQAAVARRDVGQVQEIDSLLSAAPGQPLPSVSAGTLDRVRIAMTERAGTAARRGANDIASGLRGRSADVNATLDTVPEMAPARANYASHSRAIEGVQDLGPTVLQAAPDDFAASLAGMDERGLDATRIGARQAITDAVGQRANASPVLRQIAFAPNTQRNLTALFGQEEAQRFIQAARLNLGKANNASFIAPNTGSQTAAREADTVTFGNMLRMVRDPVRAVLEKFANGLTLTDREAAELVRLGISHPSQAAQVLNGGRGAAVNALAARAAGALPGLAGGAAGRVFPRRLPDGTIELNPVD